MVTSTKATGGTPAPAVTVVVRDKETGTGWKKNGFVGKLCSDAKTTETIMDCIESTTYNMSEISTNVEMGLGYFGKVVKDPWTEYFSYGYGGQTYTLEISEKIGFSTVWSNPLRILLKENLLHDLYIYDPKFSSHKTQTLGIQVFTNK